MLMQLAPLVRHFTDAKTDGDYRVALYTKMLNLFPLHRQQNLELTLLSFVDETRGVPLFALDAALRTLTRETDRAFRPSVGEILNVAAREIARVRRRALGLDPLTSTTNPMPGDNVDRWLETGRRWVEQPDPEGEDLLYLTPELEQIAKRISGGARPAIGAKAFGDE